MSITLKLRIPCTIAPLVRVHPDQKITIMNHVNIFPLHKMIFFAKGIILPYNKTMKQCCLSDGDTVYSLVIKEKDSILDNILNTNKEISMDQIRNHIPVFGPCYEANLTSINKILEQSLNPYTNKNKIIIDNASSYRELARLHDIKLMKKDSCRKSWRKQLVSYLSKHQNYNCQTTNIDYDPAKEPCSEALPTLF